MGKRWSILAVLLTLAGAVGLGGATFDKNKEQRKLASHKREYGQRADKFLDEFREWSKLAPQEQVNLLRARSKYENQEQVKQYRARKELRELIVTASTLSLTAGAGILAAIVCGRFIGLTCRTLARLRGTKKEIITEPTGNENTQEAASQEKTANGKGYDEPKEEINKEEMVSEQVNFQRFDNKERTDAKKQIEQFGTSVTNSGGTGLEGSEKTSEKGLDHKSRSKYSEMSFGQIREAFETQARSLREKTKAFELSARCVQDSSSENAQSVNDKLTELTQQICAIREYAAQQQERVKKLQDGYDWSIIKNFCLRVIRCLDNLESRIVRLSEESIDVKHLEELRQELIFALESSGVEQFEAELYSDYRGQERRLEVLRERKDSDSAQLSGKVAEVVKPGYQCVIDEDNVKIVRPAQVRVFN